MGRDSLIRIKAKRFGLILEAIRLVQSLQIAIRQGLKVPVSLFARLKASLRLSHKAVISGFFNPATGKAGVFNL